MSNPVISLTDKTFLDTGLPLFAGLPHKVADLSDATVRFGRKELDLALVEMPGLAAPVSYTHLRAHET